jgi:hypothetical protein
LRNSTATTQSLAPLCNFTPLVRRRARKFVSPRNMNTFLLMLRAVQRTQIFSVAIHAESS